MKSGALCFFSVDVSFFFGFISRRQILFPLRKWILDLKHLVSNNSLHYMIEFIFGSTIYIISYILWTFIRHTISLPQASFPFFRRLYHARSCKNSASLIHQRIERPTEQCKRSNCCSSSLNGWPQNWHTSRKSWQNLKSELPSPITRLLLFPFKLLPYFRLGWVVVKFRSSED